MRSYYELHTNKLDNLEARDTFPEAHHLPRLNGKETENLSRRRISKKTDQ